MISRVMFLRGFNLLEIAKVHLEKEGYCDEAKAALEEAETIFQRLDAKTYLEQIRSLRAKYVSEGRREPSVPLKYMESLSQVSELINLRLGKDNFLMELLSLTLKLTGAERGMVFLVCGKELYPIASHAVDSVTVCDAERVSQTVINRMMQEHEPVYTHDATLDERFNRARSILVNKIRSFICAPLKTDGKVTGTIYLDSKRVGLFNAENVLYFKTLGNLLAASIDKSLEYKELEKRLSNAGENSVSAKLDVVTCGSSAMRKLYSELERLGASDTNVLIEGETGTGKGVCAKLIHEKTARRDNELYTINCGVLPEGIFEAELFGTIKGAYTGATRDRTGLIEAASGSTVFLDEISNTTLSVQAKLLEVIEDKVIRRIGETKKRKVDVRFIFATNRDLKLEVEQGRFREDLYFRISTVRLRIPPLRERREDIPELLDFFVKKISAEQGRSISGIDKEVLDDLAAYHWPGNVREVRSTVERAVLLAKDGHLTRDLFEPHFFQTASISSLTLRQAGEPEKRKFIESALREAGGDVGKAATRLGVSRSHLYRLLKKYDV